MFGHVFEPARWGDPAAWRPSGSRRPRDKEDIPLNTPKDAVPAPVDPKAKDKAAKTDSDIELEGLMSEIETDLREEELKKIWNNYGTQIVVLVALMILGVGAFEAYKYFDLKQRTEVSNRYAAASALLEERKTDEALTAFTALSQDAVEGYRALAQLNQAGLLIEKKDIEGATKIYTALAADGTADPVHRDLAGLLRVLHNMDREDPKVLESVVVSLIGPGKPFNLSALEAQALLAAKQGDMARAVKTLELIASDPSASQTMRQRAEDLTKLYQAGVIPPPSAPPATPAAAAPAAAAPAAPTAKP